MSLGPSARRISRVACRVPGVVPCVGPGTATGHSDQRGDEPADHPWQDAIESVRRIEGHLGGAAIGAQKAMKAIFFQAMSSTWATRRRAARDRAGRPARSDRRAGVAHDIESGVSFAALTAGQVIIPNH